MTAIPLPKIMNRLLPFASILLASPALANPLNIGADALGALSAASTQIGSQLDGVPLHTGAQGALSGLSGSTPVTAFESELSLPGLDANESGLVEIGIADGNNDGNGSLLGLSVLGSGASGHSSQGLGAGVLNDGELLHIELAGGEIIAVPLGHGLGTTVHDLVRALTLPIGHALPNLNLLPGISLLGGNDVGNANELINIGVFVGDNGGTGGAIGLAVLSGQSTSEASLLGIGILNQGEGGSGSSAFDWGAIGVLDGDQSAQAEWLGVSVLGGENSGTAERGIGLGLLNDGEILHLDLAGTRYLLIPALPAPLDGLGGDLHATLRAWLVPVGAFLPALNAIDGLSLLGGETGDANPLLNIGALAGDSAGSGGVIGLAVLSGSDAASGQSLGVGVLNQGEGSAAGSGNSSGGFFNPGQGWIAVGVLNGQGSGNGQWVALGALSGNDSGQASAGLGIGVLNGDETLRVSLAGNDLASLPALPSPLGDLGDTVRDTGRGLLVPVGEALPDLPVLPGIEALGMGNPQDSNPVANVGALRGDGAGSGGLIGIAAVAGDNAGEGAIAGINVLSGDSATGTKAGSGNAGSPNASNNGNSGSTGGFNNGDQTGGSSNGSSNNSGGSNANGGSNGSGGSDANGSGSDLANGNNGQGGSGAGAGSGGGSNGNESGSNGGTQTAGGGSSAGSGSANGGSGSDTGSGSSGTDTASSGNSGGSGSNSSGAGSSSGSGSGSGSGNSGANSGTEVADSGSGSGSNGASSDDAGAADANTGSGNSDSAGNDAAGGNGTEVADAGGSDGSGSADGSNQAGGESEAGQGTSSGNEVADSGEHSKDADQNGCLLPQRKRRQAEQERTDERTPRCDELQRTEGA